MNVMRTVTLTAAATNYTLKQLLDAAAVAGEDPNRWNNLAELKALADSGNAGPVLVGDATLDDNNYGLTLSGGDSFIDGAGNMANTESSMAYLFRTPAGGAAGQKLHVFVRFQ